MNLISGIYLIFNGLNSEGNKGSGQKCHLWTGANLHLGCRRNVDQGEMFLLFRHRQGHRTGTAPLIFRSRDLAELNIQAVQRLLPGGML